ncbi:TetR/AcrR family transcriptional regulator [Desulfitobacterium chlororespirans]|uniref:Transcriptional regulator, TetR family n=1 Tax=Desulfitobacterium chlororespirans DSM 11544 TaxID=1121395 RepID=A0A1M7SIE3_9FIRM|nr:TetR/AcrR family transcriptional regulator [Desulfitobacterium chlororespirans]SHN58200.1 transcriptional regulator, TetR family [Desulfitobacterium chlororespirans DSM 11544]
MDSKRKLILETAAKFFSSNGFHATSVQDIAKDCNVSKASIYQLFDSKEDILLQLLQYKRDQIIQGAALSAAFDSLAPQEQLIEKIVMEFEGFHQDSDFMSILMHSDQSIRNHQVKHLIDETQWIMLHWHKESLSAAYGPKTDAYLWELSLTFQGIVKEFFAFLENRKEIRPDYRSIASFIAGTMDAIIEHGNYQDAVLPEDIILELNNTAPAAGPSLIEEWEKATADLKRMIEATIPQPGRKDLIATISLIDEEKRQDEPRGFLIEALFVYLTKHPELKESALHLEQIFLRQLKIKGEARDGYR